MYGKILKENMFEIRHWSTHGKFSDPIENHWRIPHVISQLFYYSCVILYFNAYVVNVSYNLNNEDKVAEKAHSEGKMDADRLTDSDESDENRSPIPYTLKSVSSSLGFESRSAARDNSGCDIINIVFDFDKQSIRMKLGIKNKCHNG